MSMELFSGMEKAPLRATLKALGLTDSELKKPLIAVVRASSGITPYSDRLAELADAIKAGIYAGGCTPIEVNVPDMCGTVSGTGAKYALPTRELVADSVETLLTAHSFEGAVFAVGGDMATAGALIGAARVNIPSVFVTAGALLGGTVLDKKAGITDVFEGVGAVSCGTIDMDKLTELENRAGCDNGMSAANALGVLCEALGMALVGNGSVPSAWSERIRLAKKSGLAVCDLVRDAVTPRMIMTKRAIMNALAVGLAVNAPSDVVLHFLALATECNVPLDLDAIQKLSDAVPTLVALKPAGDKDLEDFCNAGGVRRCFTSSQKTISWTAARKRYRATIFRAATRTHTSPTRPS